MEIIGRLLCSSKIASITGDLDLKNSSNHQGKKDSRKMDKIILQEQVRFDDATDTAVTKWFITCIIF